MNKRSLIVRFKWILSVSRRFSRIDRKGRSAVTSRLATLGIAAGVMTLIVVMSVMNGFQLSFIDAIQEISSFHIRVNDLPPEDEIKLEEYCDSNKHIKSYTKVLEAQSLISSQRGAEGAAIIRAVDPSLYYLDQGFYEKVNMVQGTFDLSSGGQIILGSKLARDLGVRVGQNVNLLVLSGKSDVDLFSQDRTFKVSGVFSCGYAQINSSFAFISLEDGYKYFGSEPVVIQGIKIQNVNKDLPVIHALQKEFPEAKVESWRTYNKAFFGALKIEKNMLLLLVALIFVVVAINIYNGMRRLVFDRRSEIAIFSALGAPPSEIQCVFVMRGIITGFLGAFTGLLAGLLISYNTDVVFILASKVMYGLQYLVTAIFNHENLQYISQNSSYLLYASIPARVQGLEVFFISLFGFLSPVFASFAASKNVLKLTIAEVLHYE